MQHSIRPCRHESIEFMNTPDRAECAMCMCAKKLFKKNVKNGAKRGSSVSILCAQNRIEVSKGCGKE